MAKGQFLANAKWAFTDKQNLKGYAFAAIGGLAYTIIPTVLNVNYFGGMAIGAGVSLLAGIWFKQPAFLIAAAAIIVTHLMYTHGNQVVNKALSRPIWRLSDTAVTPTGALNDYAYDYAMGDQVVLPTGEVVQASVPGDYASDGGMSNYLAADNGLSNYLAADNGLSNYLAADNGLSNYLAADNGLQDGRRMLNSRSMFG